MTLFFILTPCVARAVTVFVPNNGYDTTAGFPGVGSVYYKCDTSVTWPDCDTDVVQLSYSGINDGWGGNAGTMADPYQLTNCSFVSCACSYTQYLSGSTCVSCSNNTLALPEPGTHTNTSCQYCPYTWLMMHPAQGVTICVGCPSNGTCNGTTTLTCNKGYYGTTSCTACPNAGVTKSTGSKNVTDCYLPKGATFGDITGYGVYTADCPY